MNPKDDIAARVSCPCCQYPTLRQRGANDVCELCNWEDDGQGNADPALVRGGPNGRYSLAEARENFRDHLSMYALDKELLSNPPTEREQRAKRALVSAFERLGQMGPAPEVLREIEEQENILVEELHRSIAAYEQRIGKGS